MSEAKRDRRAQRRAYYLANKERTLAQVRAWKAANPEKVRAHSRAKYWRDPEKSRAYNRLRYRRQVWRAAQAAAKAKRAQWHEARLRRWAA